jgi:hypothetical protein
MRTVPSRRGARDAAEGQPEQCRPARQGHRVAPTEVSRHVDHVAEAAVGQRLRQVLQSACGLLDQLGGRRLVLLAQLVAGAAHGLGKCLNALRRGALLLFDLVRCRRLHRLGCCGCRLFNGVANAVTVTCLATEIRLLT